MKRIIIYALAGLVLLIVGMASGVGLVVLDTPSPPEPRLKTVRTIAVSVPAADNLGRKQGGSL